jgi:hypothetical protein
MTKAQKAGQAKEAIETLREILPPGSTVHVYCTHVSRSGMSRNIVPLAIYVDDDGQPQTRHIGYLVSKAIDARANGDQGVKMGGCGMDMGFGLVHSLSYMLHPEGFGCTGERCPSNDHSNGDRDRTPHDASHSDCPNCAGRGIVKGTSPKDGAYGTCVHKGAHWHKSSGYSLRCEWI